MKNGIFQFAATTALTIALSASPAFAQKKYDTGATDTEIKFGQTVPFSGDYSAYANIAKTQAAYMRMINDSGRHQRPEAQPDPVRRRLFATKDRRTGAQAGRG